MADQTKPVLPGFRACIKRAELYCHSSAGMAFSCMDIDHNLILLDSQAIIQKFIQDLAWPDLQTTLDYFAAQKPDSLSWGVQALPALTCFATGGTPSLAVPLVASWRLYALSARLFDDMVDGDKPNMPWSQWSADRSLHVGLALTFAAQACLDDLHGEAARAIHATINQALLNMLHGQATPPVKPTLDDYFNHIIPKSGLFFAAFAQAGGQLHSQHQGTLKALFEYGLAFGVMRQIRNDLGNLASPVALSDLANRHYTLPVICALSAQHPKTSELRGLIDHCPMWTIHDRETFCALLQETGALHKSVLIGRAYASRARMALQSFPPPAVEMLEAIIGEEEAQL